MARQQGDHDEPENTYGLPDGDDLRAELQRWFRDQAEQVLASIPPQMATLPAEFVAIASADERLAEPMTPLIAAYWQRSGEDTLGRIAGETGLDPASLGDGPWQVTNPHLAAEIRHSTLAFCEATNRTTHLDLTEALQRLREQLHAGLVEQGDSVDRLRKRVQEIFQGAERFRARRIAITEASRAVHLAQLRAAVESGVVAGKRLLLSGDACPLCKRVHDEQPAGGFPLDGNFAVIGNNPTYRYVKTPPIHPGCRCAMVEVLMDPADWPRPAEPPKGDEPAT